MSREKVVKVILFVHSPIQKLICKKLIESSVIDSAEAVFIFSRGSGAIDGCLPNVIVSDGCLLNDVTFCLRLLSKYEFAEEIFLPHSLSFLYEAALRAKNIKKINYIEEGTGTIFFVGDELYARPLPKLKKCMVFFKKVILVFMWCLSLRFFIVSAALRSGFLFPDNSACLFIDKSSSKFGNVYLLDYWRANGHSFYYFPVKKELYLPVKKIFFSISNVEMSYSGFWQFAADLCADLLRRGYDVYYKAHPGVSEKDILKSGGREAKKFIKMSKLYDSRDDELGLALIRDGFQAAVSSFSSFFVYSNAALYSFGSVFPVLIFGTSDSEIEMYFSILPRHSASSYIFRSVEEWRACFSDRSAFE